ncbi:hypothetical protein [Methylocystis sp.]|uniref:hypothetical protein n=1 Tax=Methylocystis sp. TaxID=1911079 RepID=UPI003DA67D7F
MTLLVEICDCHGFSMYVPFARISEIRPPEDGKTGASVVKLNGDDREYTIDPVELDALLNPETTVPAADGWWGFVAAPGVDIDDAAAQPKPQAAMERHPIVGWRVGGEWPEPIFATKSDARRLVAIANLNENIVIDSFGGEPQTFKHWYGGRLGLRLERAGVRAEDFFGALKRIGEAEAAAAEANAE